MSVGSRTDHGVAYFSDFHREVVPRAMALRDEAEAKRLQAAALKAEMQANLERVRHLRSRLDTPRAERSRPPC